MNFIELFLLAIGLSMDAFAVAVCLGLTMPKATTQKSLIIGLYFGIFQASMPLIGFLFATRFADRVAAFSHIIAFVLLSFLGSKMIIGSFKKDGTQNEDVRICKEASLSPGKMLPLAVATSIDALAVGVSLAFLQVNIVPAVSFIGVTTLVISMIGVKIGSLFGARFKSKAELLGGVILLLIGLQILTFATVCHDGQALMLLS